MKPEQWILQADYDMTTAEAMINTGRYFYAVFMCHLSVEKALKGVYQKKLNALPPKTHNLIYFLNKTGLKPDETAEKFVVNLNEASLLTRYPEDLEQLQKEYTRPIVENILKKSKELLTWIKERF